MAPEINYIEIIMVGILRLIAYGILAYLIYLLYRFFRTVNKGSKKPPKMKAQSGVMVKDEACNTYLPKEDALRVSFEGRDYFFCSEDCKLKFLNAKKPH